MDARLQRLLDFFRATGPTAVAFSGGVDSSLVLWAAATALGGQAMGVTVRSEFMSAEERQRAERMAAFLAHATGVRVVARDISALADARLRGNPADRCYRCKALVLAQVRHAADQALGASSAMAEGTNDDDDPARPGLRAVAEARALSPLAACRISKAEVRELARLSGLPCADDPSDSCLATRVPEGLELTPGRLAAVEALERAARELGLADLRARLTPGPGGDAALLLVRAAQLPLAQAQAAALADRARAAGFADLSLGVRP